MSTAKLEAIANDQGTSVGFLGALKALLVRQRKVESVYHVPAYLLRDIGVEPEPELHSHRDYPA